MKSKKLEFVDMVIKLHEIAHAVNEEFSDANLHSNLRNCADRLHLLAVGVRVSELEANNAIKKARDN